MNASGGSLNHVLDKHADLEITRRASIHNRSYPPVHAIVVRVHAGSHPCKAMHMEINEPWGDEFAFGRKYVTSPAFRNILADLEDFPILHRDVHRSVQLLPRVD